MNGTLFGMGVPEILAIAILTLLVFGPDRLPGLMRNFGRGVRKMREVYTALSAEVQKELGPYAKEIDEATRDLRKDINSIREITDVRNLIPPITLAPDPAVNPDTPPAPKTPAPPAGPTIGGVAMSPVNDTPLSFPPFDPVPLASSETPAENTLGPPGPNESVSTPADPVPAPPPPAAVRLSDDNPWTG